MNKKAALILLVLFGIFPATQVNSQTETFTDLAKKLLKWGDTMSNLSSKVQTATEMKRLIEDLACAKYQFDKYRLHQKITSCIGNTNMTLVDIEYSSLYREVYSMTKFLVDPAAMDDSKVSGIMKKIRALLDKLTSLNASAEAEFTDQQQTKAQRNFTSSVLGSSF